MSGKRGPMKPITPLSRHPAIIVACILVIGALAIVAQFTGENETWKIVAAGIIAWILGIPTGVILTKRAPARS